MIRPPIARPGLLLIGLFAGIAATAAGQSPRPFVVPKDRATWEAQRGHLRGEVSLTLMGLPSRPGDPGYEVRARESRPGLAIERFRVDNGAGGVGGVLALPEGAGPGDRVPLILVVGAPSRMAGEAADRPGVDGRPAVETLGLLGFASMAVDADPRPANHLRDLAVGLDATLGRPDVDPRRVGVIGLGPAGPMALALMAVDGRIACGVSSVEARDFADLGPYLNLGLDSDRFETSTFVDLLAALCAPRPLALYYGERLPLPTRSAGRRLEGGIRRLYKSYGSEGAGLTTTHFGEFPGHDSVATRLQWMGGLEQFEKHFRPQGPAPLGHDPEPEPAPDPRAVDLAERGIAGWAAEMSHRAGCWSWLDGVISCKPGPNEYGWFRAPVEVGDFLLTVEWRVPKGGNAGIFLRARPVAWSVPPGDQSKPRVSALGLDWPSRTGLELQAQDDPGQANLYSSGSLYRHAAPAANPTNPPGQWNRYTVRARGLRVEVWSNGRQVLDTTLDRCSATLPNPPLRGYIGLQNHGAPAEYRNVRLVRLGDPTP